MYDCQKLRSNLLNISSDTWATNRMLSYWPADVSDRRSKISRRDHLINQSFICLSMMQWHSKAGETFLRRLFLPLYRCPPFQFDEGRFLRSLLGLGIYGDHEHRIDDLRENLKIVRQRQPPFDPILNDHHILNGRCCSIHEVDFYCKLEGNISLISQINGWPQSLFSAPDTSDVFYRWIGIIEMHVRQTNPLRIRW